METVGECKVTLCNDKDFVCTHTAYKLNTQLSEWQTDGFERRAGVSSFGLGGTNAHVVLEDAPTFNLQILNHKFNCGLLLTVC